MKYIVNNRISHSLTGLLTHSLTRLTHSSPVPVLFFWKPQEDAPQKKSARDANDIDIEIMMSLPMLFVVIGLCLVVLANAEKLEYHSFEPPFEEVDYGGDRMVSLDIMYCLLPSSYS